MNRENDEKNKLQKIRLGQAIRDCLSGSAFLIHRLLYQEEYPAYALLPLDDRTLQYHVQWSGGIP